MNFKRILRTLVFVAFGFFSIVVTGLWNPQHSYWLWALLLLVAPFFIFNLTGGEAQFELPEWAALIVLGGLGVFFFTLWRIWGGPDYPYYGFWHVIHLGLFWGYAGVGCWKAGGTIAAFFNPERYSREYLDGLQSSSQGSSGAKAGFRGFVDP